MASAAGARTVAVIGAGWAGCAAAVDLCSAGHVVHVFEAARIPGGRARQLHANTASGVPPWQAHLDNGQHILLGAYRETLRLMQRVGVDLQQTLLRLPLQMVYPPGTGGMDLRCPRLPAPLHLAVGLWRAGGLQRADRMALARFSTAARWIDWRLNTDCSVAELLQRFDQTARAVTLLWRPLCLAALNTPPERASAQVFLNVLRDSLGARRAASDMLLPRVDLSQLLPIPALAFVTAHGGVVHAGVRITGLERAGNGWHLQPAGIDATAAPAALTAPQHFDAVVVATPAQTAATLLGGIVEADSWPALAYEPIATCYLHYPPSVRLARPFYALLDDPGTQRWGQFVFDRGHLDARQAGVLAVVVSAAAEATALETGVLAASIAAQIATDLGQPALGAPLAMRTVIDKRATFSCTPGLVRPGCDTGVTGLARAGDYVAGDYPSTLEGAVRSGRAAARLVMGS